MNCGPPSRLPKGETELALRRPRQAEDYRVVLESNLEEIDRMSRIVDELIIFIACRSWRNQIENGSRSIGRSYARNSSTGSRVLGKERQIQTRSSQQIEPVVVEGDDLRLRELLLNLVDNAVKYSREGQTVELSLGLASETRQS